MNLNREIYDAIKKNNNMITTSQVLSLGYSKQLLTNYVKEGLLERCRHGVYTLPDAAQVVLQNYMFYRNDERDDYWHMGAGTLIKSGTPDEGVLQSPGTMHCGEEGVPFCSEAWDCISRYIYAALQGGAIMHGLTFVLSCRTMLRVSVCCHEYDEQYAITNQKKYQRF